MITILAIIVGALVGFLIFVLGFVAIITGCDTLAGAWFILESLEDDTSTVCILD